MERRGEAGGESKKKCHVKTKIGRQGIVSQKKNPNVVLGNIWTSCSSVNYSLAVIIMSPIKKPLSSYSPSIQNGVLLQCERRRKRRKKKFTYARYTHIFRSFVVSSTFAALYLEITHKNQMCAHLINIHIVETLKTALRC